MIQRIQSAYLLLVIAIGASLFFLPFASVNLLSNVTSFKLLHLMDVTDYENGIVKTVTSIFIPAIVNTILLTLALLRSHILKQNRLIVINCL